MKELLYWPVYIETGAEDVLCTCASASCKLTTSFQLIVCEIVRATKHGGAGIVFNIRKTIIAQGNRKSCPKKHCKTTRNFFPTSFGKERVYQPYYAAAVAKFE